MNNNVPIARWLSMFWLCSAVSLVLGQFSGSVTLNGTNGAALTVTGILGIFCTLVQFYPFYRFSRVSERLQRAFTATVLSVAATVVGGKVELSVPAMCDLKNPRPDRLASIIFLPIPSRRMTTMFS